MKKLITLITLICALAFTGCNNKTAAVNASTTPREKMSLETENSPEWVTALDQAKDAKQLFIVSAVGDTTAWISMHEKDKDGSWKMIMTTPGFIGKNGYCDDSEHAEGCAQTPLGTYHFTKAFGIADDPGCAMPYTKVTEDTYWSGDQREGMHYNEMVSIKDYPDLDKENSEHIIDYTYPYQYCLNISFNEEGTSGRGSAIFLHCFGDRKPYTGGCVAVPMDQMYFIMKHVTPDCVVVIDTMENLDAEFSPGSASPATADIPGTYVQTVTDEMEGEDVTFQYKVTLNDDHTGILNMQDDIPVTWDETIIKARDGGVTYTYTIEGDKLIIDNDGIELEFIKSE